MMTHPTDPRTTSESPNLATNIVAALRLRFRGGQHHGQVVRVSSQKCTIGSAPNATLRLSCPGVHPVHCLVLRGEAGTVIRRMSPDTLLNGEQFEDEALNAGDTLSIGPIEFEVLADSEQSAAPADSQPSNATDNATNENNSNDNATAEKLAELEAQLAQLTSERGKWEEYRVAEESRLQEWSQSLETHSQQMQVSQEQDQASEVRFREQLEALESTNQQLVGKLEALQSQYDSEAAARSEQTAAVEASLVARTALDSELDVLRSQVSQFESLSSEKQQLATEAATLREQLSNALESQQSVGSIQEAHDAMVREVEVLRKQIDQAEEYCNKWEQQQQQLEGDLAAANLANSEKENELQSLRSKFAETNQGALEQQWDTERQQLQLQLQYAQQQLAAAGQTPPQVEQPIAYVAPEQPVEQPMAQQPVAEQAYEAVAQEPVETPAPDANFIPPTQTMSMDQLQSFDEEAPASTLETTTQTQIYDESATQEEPGRDSAMAMLDKLRAELGTGSEAPAEQQPAVPVQEPAAYEPAPVAVEPAPAYTPPTPEEVTYAEPESAAPVNTAAILAQFGHAVEEDPAPEPFVQSQPETPVAPAAEEGGGEDDIQDYMAQLMQRVGGGEEEGGKPEAPKKKSAPPVAHTQTQKVEVPTAKPTMKAAPTPPPTQVLDPSEFIPRAVAPEANGGLKALRAVANTSTRSALDRHQRRSLDTKALLSGILAMVALCVCISAGYFSLASKQIVSLSSLASLVCGFIGLLALVKALAFSARSKLGKNRRQQNLKQLSAR